MSRTPYIGFSNATLGKLPAAKAGDVFTCTECGESHALKASDEGSERLLSYRCGEGLYIGAINGRLVVGVTSDVSGTIDTEKEPFR